MFARRLCLLLSSAALLPLPAAAEVFINEIHYDDNTSTGDTGERIEIVATAGENLGAYRIYLYNGATPSAATYYDNDLVPAGSAVTCGAGVRIATVAYPTNGIQNGSPDAIALVDGSGRLVQFLSYEGTVTGSNGPAAGRMSIEMPVSENGTAPAGTSLQLGGTATGSAGFSWNASATQTFGTCNRGQVFSVPNPPPAVTSVAPANGATGVPAATNITVTFSESVSTVAGAFALQCGQSGAVALSGNTSGSSFTLTPASVLRSGETCTFTVTAAKVTDSGGAHPTANTTSGFTVATATAGYWQHVNTSSASQLRCTIHQTIRGHTVYPYSGGTTNVWTILEVADEDPNNSGRVLDAYRNHSFIKVSERDTGSGSTGIVYNKEHTWPNSLGFPSTTGDLGLPYAPYTDTHMLYATEKVYNANRGNKPYADCTSAANCTENPTEFNNGAGGGSGVFPGNSNWVMGPDGNAGSFQVWSKRRGDMARAVMYMAIRYEGGKDVNTGQSEPDLELTDDRSKIIKTSTGVGYMGLLSTLLAWHQADPPDAAERARDQVIYTFQGNRNPFIDHPEWASAALFNSAKPATCQPN